MIKINNQYLDRFKLVKGTYLFYVRPGVFLSFNSVTLEYQGPVSFIGWYKSIDEECDTRLNEIITKGLLEVY